MQGENQPTHAFVPSLAIVTSGQPGNLTIMATSSMDEYALSHQLVSNWTAVAARGEPSTRDLQWPKYDRCPKKGVPVQDKEFVAKLDFEEDGFWSNSGRYSLGRTCQLLQATTSLAPLLRARTSA